MVANALRLDFQVLIYQEGDFWIAHCLETDLVAEGASPKGALESLVDISNSLIEAQIAEGDIRAIFSPAPAEIWRMYATASDTRSPRPRRAVKPLNRLNVRKLTVV